MLQIGTGRWGANHLRVLRALPIDLYVCDSRPEAYPTSCAPLEILRDRFSTDHRAFLDQVDAVDVVTPADSHFALVREAISRGKDVFVEKPITLSSRDARVLVEEAERASRVLQVGYIFRHDAACLWARQAIRDGRLGQVRMIRAKFTGFKRPRSDSGVLLADGIHFIDLAGFLLGKTPRRVTAVLRDFLGRGMDDEAWMGLEFDGASPAGAAAPGGAAGAWGSIEGGYHVPGEARGVVSVGSEATARCDLAEAREKVRIFRNRHVKKGTEWQAVEGEAEAISFAPLYNDRAAPKIFPLSLHDALPT